MDKFYADLTKLRDKYPMCYIEAWTPDDFEAATNPEEPKVADWDEDKHISTAGNLHHRFDANYGTNWESLKLASGG